MKKLLISCSIAFSLLTVAMNAQVQEIPISLSVDQPQSLSVVLDEIQNEYALFILYDLKAIDGIIVENLNIQNQSLGQVLDELKARYGIKYSIQNDLVNVFGPNENITEAQAFSGSVNLNEIVTTGYSNQRRNTMATSVSKLDKKVLESVSRSNPATALQGTIAGLKVTQNTGQPGSTPTITLRGGTDFNGSGSPLVLIDNVPSSFYALNADDIESIEVLKDAAASAIYGARAANGVILITTKKGKAGKTSINIKTRFSYNDRQESKMKYMNAEEFVKFNRMAIGAYRDQIDPNGFSQFINGQNPAGIGNNTTNSIYTTMVLSDENRYLLGYPGWQTIEDPLNPGQQLIFQDNDMSDLFYQTSTSEDYNVSLSGGNEKGTYYLGLGHLHEKGLAYGSDFKRISANFNASYKITEKFKVSSSLLYGHSNYTPNYLNNDYSVFQRAAGIAPTARIYYNNPDGSLSDRPHPGTEVNFGNPLYYADKFERKNLEQRLTANVQLDYNFLPDFNLMIRGGHFTLNDRDETFEKAYYSKNILYDARKSSAEHEQIFRNQATTVLSYNKKLSKNNINALVGLEYYNYEYWVMSAGTKNSPIDLIHTMNVASEADGVPSSETTEYAINSFFGQVNYDYDDRYLIGLTFRRDGTSRLAPDNKYEFFPGASFGWNIHNESFFNDSSLNSVINILKPRISYGVNGNIEVLSNYGVFGEYKSTGIYDSKSGFLNTSLPNYSLKWEKSKTLNFGLDLGLFNNRVSIIADYFIRDVQDKLGDLTLPVWTGFSKITVNNGILQNKGFELELNADVVRTKDFNWNISGTYYQVRNYAKELPDNGVEKNRQGGTQIYNPSTGELIYVGGLQEGERVGLDVITSYVFDGVYQTQADIDEHAGRTVTFAKNQTTRFLGDTKYKDLNGDNIIDYRDRKVIGRTTPDFSGGLNTSLTYKGFNLFVKTDFAVGHYISNGRKVKGMAQTQGAQNGPELITQTWTPENPTANLPRYVFVDPQHNHRAGGFDQGDHVNGNSLYWEKGDYLALREITLSYNLSGDKINNIFNNMRIFITGSNLHYFTDYSGNSPETGNSGKNNGIDKGSYPIPRTYTVGLSLTF